MSVSLPQTLSEPALKQHGRNVDIIYLNLLAEAFAEDVAVKKEVGGKAKKGFIQLFFRENFFLSPHNLLHLQRYIKGK